VAVATDQARQAATAARSTVARVERVLAPIDMRSTADLMYLTNPDRRWAELNLDFRRGSADFARIGVADIGEFTRWNLQVGRPLGPGNVRLGLLQSKFGLGYDAWLSPRFGLTAEVFDPNDIRANLMGQYYFRPAPDGWAALLGLRDIGGDPRLAIGVRLQN
jgi:phospholipid/cholesterol/gamma-HCH transport system substrate-binding protein